MVCNLEESTKRTTKKKKGRHGERQKRKQCLLVLANTFKIKNFEKMDNYTYCLTLKKQRSVNVSSLCYRHVMATAWSNACLEREGVRVGQLAGTIPHIVDLFIFAIVLNGLPVA